MSKVVEIQLWEDWRNRHKNQKKKKGIDFKIKMSIQEVDKEWWIESDNSYSKYEVRIKWQDYEIEILIAIHNEIEEEFAKSKKKKKKKNLFKVKMWKLQKLIFKLD